MTTLAEARNAINSLFITNWTDSIPYTLDNEQFTPPTTSAWLRMSVVHYFSEQATLGEAGNRRFERSGDIWVQVFTLLGKGLAEADRLTMLVRAMLEGKVIGTNIYTFAAIVQERGPTEGWYQVNIKVPFSYDERT